MSVVPDSKLGKIQFAEAHVTPWTDNAAGIGSSPTAITAWHTLVTAARAAYEAQQAAELARRDATNDLNLALDAMDASTALIIKGVRLKAAQVGDSVYSLASLPVPPAPSPKPAPGKPTDLKVSLDETGVINLAFKCVNPAGTSGTIYQVWRQIGEAGTLEYLGGVGEKKFSDDTLPAGSANVMYQIQAVRSTSVGPWATFNVKFGVNASGFAVIKSVTETTPKIAA